MKSKKQKVEIRKQKSEIRKQKVEIRKQKTEPSEIFSKLNFTGQESEISEIC